MSNGFSLAEAIKASAVSDPDTSRRITDIDIDALTDDPNNFYELSGLDELAANIETVGLQQPLLVRPAAEEGQYVIVSSHRRRAAIRKLVDDGREDLRLIPCIVDSWEGSEAMRELRLIYANADTRRMTSAEISRQAERVETLLYQLQEEGYSFPGRMRDHVAEACKVSRTKLARLKVIRERLIPEAAAYWERGEWSEAAAYRLAQEEEDIQRLTWKYGCKHLADDGHLTWCTEWGVENTAKKVKGILNVKCKHHVGGAGKCSHWGPKLTVTFGPGARSCENKCCADCWELGKCKNSCPKVESIAAAKRAERNDEQAQRKAEQREKDTAKIEAITRIWDRFGKAREAAGNTVKDCWDAMGMGYGPVSREDYPARERGEGIEPNTGLPFGYGIDLDDINRLNDVADLLGCSVDYLLGRTVPLDPDRFEGQPVLNGWMPGSTNPGAIKGDCVGVFVMDDENGQPRMETKWRTLCWWNGSRFTTFRSGGLPIKERCVRWMRLPPEPEEVGD